MEPASTGPVRWRVKRSLAGRRGDIANELVSGSIMLVYGLAAVGLGVLLIVFMWPPSVGEAAGSLVWALGGVVLITVCVVSVRAPLRELRRREDRVWLDEADLWWTRHRPAVPGAEPERVSRAEIVRVRLADDDAVVVVDTADGIEHVLTDLGSLADRVALANAIGDRIGPGTARVHPESPPELPHAWETRPGSDSGATLLWRRPNLARPWGVAALGYLWTVTATAFVSIRAPAGLRIPLFVVVFLGLAGLVRWFVHEIRLTRTGWLARSGRLEAVRIRARTGRQPAGPREVAALELGRGRWPGQRLLRAVLGAGESTVVTRGWNRRRIDALAAWLAGRADIPLSRDRATDREAGPTRAQRTSRKNARTSSMSVAGSSNAAK
jgi:hypothetical protein